MTESLNVGHDGRADIRCRGKIAHCRRGRPSFASGRNSFNRPFIFANWNNRAATSRRAGPTRAKALRIKPPRTSALTAGFCERLPGQLAMDLGGAPERVLKAHSSDQV